MFPGNLNPVLKGKSLNAYETTCSNNSFNLSYEVPSDTNKKVF